MSSNQVFIGTGSSQLGLALLQCCLIVLAACSGSPKELDVNDTGAIADAIYYNGKVYTANESQIWADAVAISDDEFVFVGSNEKVKQFAGEATAMHDLAGKMILPGLIDTHTHPLTAAAFSEALILQGDDDAKEVVRAVAEYAKKNKNREVIFGFGFSATAFGPNGPDKALLDEVISDRPVLLLANSFHSAWANSKALEVLGITRDTPDISTGFSYYKRDENNDPTGYLLEATAHDAMGALGVFALEPIVNGSANIFRAMNSYGITALFDGGDLNIAHLQLPALEILADRGQLNIRYVGSHKIKSPDHLHDAVDITDDLRRTSKHERFHINTLKIVSDGTLTDKTAAVFDDYKGDSGNNGRTIFSQQQMNRLIGEAAQRNIDVHIHSTGDRAVHQVLNAIEYARSAFPDTDSRFTICHARLIADDDIERFSKLDVIAQTTPMWMAYDDAAASVLSKEQFSRLFRFNSLEKQGVRLTFGSDYPARDGGILGLSPIVNMGVGMTRQYFGQESAPILPNETERLDLASLIRGYTIDAAYQLRMEDEIGSIEVGKKADMVILDRNLFEVDPYSFPIVKVVNTVMNGNVVY